MSTIPRRPSATPVPEGEVGTGEAVDFDLGADEVDRHEESSRANGTFRLLDREWELLPGVFAPYHSRSTESYTRWLPLDGASSFLEMGCGAGVTAVHAALAGCTRVTAVDISGAAVRNVRANARRHGVDGRVEALCGDMFDPVEGRFDVVFWNSSAIPAPASFDYTREIEWSIFDREYASHRRYLREGPRHLTPGGRLFLGFNSNGDGDRLAAEAAAAGVALRTVEERTGTYDGATTARFSLIEIVAGPGRPGRAD